MKAPGGGEPKAAASMKIVRHSRPIFFFGTVGSQTGWLIVGILAGLAVFGRQPNSGFSNGETASGAVLLTFAAGFLGGGLAKGRAFLNMMESGATATGRLLKTRADNSGDSTMYEMTFEYSAADGRSGTVQIERRHADMVVGQEVSLLIGANRKEGLLERDLAGGMTFSNVSGAEPIPMMCLIRILFIPALALAPFLGLMPQITSWYRQITVITGYPVAYYWPVFAQVAWLFTTQKRIRLSGHI
jgi:hypothetical protein